MPATVTTATLELNAVDNVSAVMKRVSGTVDDLGKSYDRLKSMVLGFGGALSVGAFASMINGAIDAQDALYKLSQRTGLTVETLSSLRLVARQSGTDMETVGTVVNRLEKTLLQFATEPTKQLQVAFGALGITQKQAEEGLKNIGAFLPQLAQKLIGTGTAAEQAALAQTLFGRSGAQLLPFLNQLAEAGTLQATVTTEQAKRAEEFKNQLDALAERTQVLKESMANGLLPALSQIVQAYAGLSAGGKDVSGSFETLGAILKTLATAAGSFWLALTDMGDAIGALAAQGAALLRGDLAAFKEIGAERDRQSAANEAAFNKFQNSLMSGGGQLAPGPVSAKIAAPLDLSALGGAKPQSGHDSQQPYWDQYIANAKEADKELKGLQADDEKHRQELERQNDVLDQQAQHWKDIVDPMAPYQRDLEQINALLDAGKLTQEQWADASKHVQDEMDKLGQKAKDNNDIAQQLGMTFSSAFEDAIVKGKSFRDIITGIGEDIARLIVRQTITKPFASALSNAISAYMSGGSSGSAGTASMGDYTAGGGFDNVDWASAASSAGASYDVGTPYVPKDGLAYLHKGEAVVPAGQGGGDTHVHLSVTAMDARSFMAYEPVILGMFKRAVNARGRVTAYG